MLTPLGILTHLCTSNWYCPLRSRANHIFTHIPCALIQLYFITESGAVSGSLFFLSRNPKESGASSSMIARSDRKLDLLWFGCVFSSGYSILERKGGGRPRQCLEMYTTMLYIMLTLHSMYIFCMRRVSKWLATLPKCSVCNSANCVQYCISQSNAFTSNFPCEFFNLFFFSRIDNTEEFYFFIYFFIFLHKMELKIVNNSFISKVIM